MPWSCNKVLAIPTDCNRLNDLTFPTSSQRTLPVSGLVMDGVHSIATRSCVTTRLTARFWTLVGASWWPLVMAASTRFAHHLCR
jgi:hypothetical protein